MIIFPSKVICDFIGNKVIKHRNGFPIGQYVSASQEGDYVCVCVCVRARVRVCSGGE